jgi:hypothetical protein
LTGIYLALFLWVTVRKARAVKSEVHTNSNHAHPPNRSTTANPSTSS